MSLSPLETDLDGGEFVPESANPLRLDVLGPQGETLRSVDLNQAVLTIGQAPGNQLMLEADGVSRYHLRIANDGKRVSVTDLGGRSGTLLNEQRLTPHSEAAMAPGAILRVGPFRLRLSEVRSASTATTTVAQHVVHGALALALAGGRETLEITPGQATVVVLVLTNNGDTPENATLAVEGIPADWVRLPEAALEVPPGSPLSLPVQILAPRESASRAGEYSVTLRARTQGSSEICAVSARWTVLPFSGSSFEMRPQKRAVRGTANVTYTLVLENSGNQLAGFSLRAGEDEPALDYQLDQNRVTLEPGASASINLEVQARENPSGRSQNYTFSVRAQPAAGTPLLATGQLTQQRPFPIWVIPTALLGLVALIALGSLLAWWLGQGTRVAVASQAGVTGVPEGMSLVPTAGEEAIMQTVQAADAAAAQAREVDALQAQLATAQN
ncbi:MAG: FHA domain-containing protein, partial [Oscillochloris sp.]|nr:FHA domain-containing protein [Oscillochloris sp.]